VRTHSASKSLCAAFFLALLAPPAARSQAPGTEAGRATFADPAAEALVAEALRQNPDVAGAAAAAEAARFRISPAETLPDPFLAFNYQNDGWAFSLGERDMTFLGMMVSQPLPWPGKLRLAGEEAELRAEGIASATVARTRLAIEARVRRAYYEYLFATDLVSLIDDRGASWRAIADIARDRYAAGLGIQQDLLRSQVEVLRLDEARADQGAILANRRAALNRLLARPQDAPIATEQRLEFRPELPELPALLASARERSPELASIGLDVQAGESRARLARKQFLPDFVASGGPMYRGSLDPMWQVGLGITLPIHAKSRQSARLSEAEADVRSARARASSSALELELRTRERYQNLDAALRVAKLYRDGILPTDQLSLESAIASYRAGKAPFVTVLEALTTLYSDRALYLARLAESETWRVALDEADLQPTGGMAAVPAAPPGASPGGGGGMAASAGMR
jgi:cobalt-zinc-cadmium efflux system outer membrane protein